VFLLVLLLLTSVVCSGASNMGMAYGRSVWERLHKRAETFCAYDDYNWCGCCCWFCC